MEGKTSPHPVATCPMASMCQGLVANRKAWLPFVMMIPGVILVALGVLVIVEPKIVVWLVAAALIVFGGLMIAMVGGLRLLAARMGRMGPGV